MKTLLLTQEQAFKGKKWTLVDAAGIPLGRLASQVAAILRGKNHTDYTPHADCGDYVVVINAAQIKLTGKKAEKKVYFDHSGFIGGIKERTAGEVLATHPERVIQRAVRCMLSKGPLGFAQLKKLKVYAGAEHPHSAQCPEAYKLAL